jgi:large subunit ribosomal protein L25
MKSIAISGSPRENVGKRDAKELRYKGLVPAVLYGGENQYHIAVSAADLRGLVYSPDAQFVELDIAGKKYKAIAQEIQFHPLNEQVVHIDFLQLFDDKVVSMNIPIKLTGVSPGVRAGGKLTQKLRALRVKALPNDMPQVIEVKIGHLEVGKSVRVEEVKIDKVRILNNADDTIVSVVMSRALRQAEQEAAAAKK